MADSKADMDTEPAPAAANQKTRQSDRLKKKHAAESSRAGADSAAVEESHPAKKARAQKSDGASDGGDGASDGSDGAAAAAAAQDPEQPTQVFAPTEAKSKFANRTPGQAAAEQQKLGQVEVRIQTLGAPVCWRAHSLSAPSQAAAAKDATATSALLEQHTATLEANTAANKASAQAMLAFTKSFDNMSLLVKNLNKEVVAIKELLEVPES